MLLVSYAKNFGWSSEGVYRTALDFMLNECLTVMVNILVSSWVVLSIHL